MSLSNVPRNDSVYGENKADAPESCINYDEKAACVTENAVGYDNKEAELSVKERVQEWIDEGLKKINLKAHLFSYTRAGLRQEKGAQLVKAIHSNNRVNV